LEEKEKIPRVRLTLEDYEALIMEIDQLKYYEENKINKLSVQSQPSLDNKKNKIDDLGKQMKLFSNEDRNVHEDIKRGLEKKTKRLEFKMGSYSLYEDIQKKENKNSQETTDRYFKREKKTENKEWLNTELEYRKHSLLNNHLRIERKTKNITNQIEKSMELIEIFTKVKTLTENKIQTILETDSFEKFESMKERYKTELESFEQNHLSSKIHSCYSNTLNECLNKANLNLAHFEEKSENVKIDDRRKLLVNINSMFTKNIKLEMQNNLLIKEIINYSGRLYNKLLERATKVENPQNFNKSLDRIEKIKQELKFHPSSNDQTSTVTMTEQEESEYYKFTESFDN
jgi:hypothetical protein